MSKPQALGEVLQAVIDRMGYRRKIDEVRAIDTWREIAGPAINHVTDDVRIEHGRLFVHIQSAVWRHQLHLQREAWRTRLNHELGRVVVDEIVFR